MGPEPPFSVVAEKVTWVFSQAGFSATMEILAVSQGKTDRMISFDLTESLTTHSWLDFIQQVMVSPSIGE